MKHPDHGIKAIIVTENKVICPESNVKIKGGVMSCKIPGSPGARWYVGCLIDRLMPTVATQSVYYIYETYLEGFLIDGPLVIDRRLITSRAHLSPSRDGDTEVFFFLPARINGQDEECYVRPKSWLIELKVYESDECFDDPRIPLSSARAIIWRRDGDLPRLEKFRDSESERLIIHYKWKYRCVELLPSSLRQKSPLARQEEKTAEPTVGQADMGKGSKEISRDISKPPMPIDCTSDSLGEILEPLPEYSWGPQPKSPPVWEQRGRGFTKLNVNSKNDIRIRSPLGERVSDVEGLAIQSRKPVALQKVPSPSHCDGPMLPIRQLEMPSLPSGWELRYTNTYKVYYVNHNDKYTTWWHPDTLEEDETHKLDQDGEVCEEKDEGERERVHDTCTKIQQLNERKELLRAKRACIEANVQKLLLGHIGPSEWREANIEHWFPENEASESIIEHTHTYFSNPRTLKCALRMRDTIIAEAASLEQELDELQYLTSLTTLEPMDLDLSDTSKIECNEVSVIEDRRKRGHFEELREEEDKLAQKPSDQHRIYISSHASSNTGQVGYREDYGPEVPVTRDGEIDPDWHRDKIARIEGPYDGKYRSESRKLWKNYDENPLSEQAYPVPRVNDLLDDDVEDDYECQIKQAIDRSLQQHNMERKAVESSIANSIESSSPNLSEYCWEDYDHSLLGKASHQQSALKSNDPEGCEMEINRESDNSMPRRISGLSISDDLRSFDLDNDHPMKAKQVSQLPEDYDTGYEKETCFDRPLLRQVSSSLKIIGDQESSDDSDLYAPPSWRRPTKTNQTDVSPSPVLVFREVQSGILQSGTAMSDQVSSEDRNNQDKHGAAISDIQHVGPTSETRAKTSGIDQTSLLSTRRNLTSPLEGDTSFSNCELANKSNTITFTMPQHDTPAADPVISPSNNKPVGEAGATASVSK